MKIYQTATRNRFGCAFPTRTPLGGKCVALFTTAALLASGSALANTNAANSTNADQLWTGGGAGLNLTGAGVTVGIWEAFEINTDNWEVRDTHLSFTYPSGPTGPSRVTYGAGETSGSDYSRHATHVAGTIGGAHIPNLGGVTPLYLETWGMAPGVNMISYNATNDTNEMLAASNPTNPANSTVVDISNHSYGGNYAPWQQIALTFNGNDTRIYDRWTHEWDQFDEEPGYGRYDTDAQAVDQTLNQRPKLLSFYSAGNSRNHQDDYYTDYESDNMFVTSFSANYLANNTINGQKITGTDFYFVSTSNYTAPGYDPGGYDSINGFAAAKNNVVIGAANDYLLDHDTDNGASIATTSFSSYGPTDDGGLGIDLVANGDSLLSSVDTNDLAYETESGTSMAAPNASGTAALLLEHWRDVKSGYTPNSATQKGLLMHTATDAKAYGDGPDYATGYGFINAAEAATHITESDGTLTRDRHAWEDTLSDGDSISLDFIATGGSLTASLSWLDPEAAATTNFDDRTSKLVHDLDIQITDEFGNNYWTWVLDPENPTGDATQNADNRVDNFTQVYIDSIAAGTELSILIDHDGTLTSDQDFTFFLTGGIYDIALPGDTDGDGDVDDTDLGTAFANFTGPITHSTGGKIWADGDTDGDGDIDDTDLGTLFSNFTGPLAGFASVPEPTSLALLTLGGLLVTRRRRA